MKQIIEDLFKFDRYLLGSGYDSAMEYIKMHIPLDTIEFKSGTEVGDWTVPKEWIIRDAWVKLNGEKLIDFKINPLSVTVCSLPVNKNVDLKELQKHLHISDEKPEAYPYDYKFYDRDWGFTMPKERAEKLVEGEYEVFIDSEDKDGVMKIGVHTVKGKTDKEILLFAHLDHPYQANDNLSAVACLMDLAGQLKDRYEHTIKLIFCPETIGSIAYAATQDISKVAFVISVDSIGNNNTLLFQKAYDKYARINGCMHLAVAGQGVSYRKGEFRLVAGADEYYFNDPKVGIPGLFVSRLPYPEYHTSADTPDTINIEKIVEVQKVIKTTIEFYERDFIPKLNVKGVIMRSKYGIQTNDKLMNRELDYLFYEIDGKKYLSEIILSLGIGFDYSYDVLSKLETHGQISRVTPSQKGVKKTTKKK